MPALKDNSSLNNFLLILCIAAIFIIAADLCTEMAAEKDEIGTFLGIFEENDTTVILPVDFLPNIERPLLFEIPLSNLSPSGDICNISVRDRSPPKI
ncbi:MAG: hypothetical protein ABI840_11060 [bacterium]